MHRPDTACLGPKQPLLTAAFSLSRLIRRRLRIIADRWCTMEGSLVEVYRKCCRKDNFSRLESWFTKSFQTPANLIQVFVSPDSPGLNFDEICMASQVVSKTRKQLPQLGKLILQSLATLILDLSKEECQVPEDDKVRCYFIMMNLPVFQQASTYLIFSYLIRAVANLGHSSWNEFYSLVKFHSPRTLSNVVPQLRQFVNARLDPGHKDLPPLDQCRWWIPLAAKILQCLHMAFVSTKAHRSGLKSSMFNCWRIDGAMLVSDFQAWISEGPNRKKGFAFSDYQFLISTSAKRNLLTCVSEEEMFTEAKKHLQAKVKNRQKLDPNIMLLEIKVRRSKLLEDSLEAIKDKRHELKKKLRVYFEGEEGIDLGGLSKEWFMLIVREIFHPECKLFVYNPETRLYWLDGAEKDNQSQLFLIGALMGLAIYNSTILNISFPRVLYKKLLSPPVLLGCSDDVDLGGIHATLDDLAEIDPTVAGGLQQLLDYDGDNFEGDFCLDFTISVPMTAGGVKCYTLKTDGQSIPVTKANRAEYVRRYTEFTVNRHVQKQFRALYKGFHHVCDTAALQLLSPDDLEAIICGENALDVKCLQKSCSYDPPFNISHPTIEMFWQVLVDLDTAKQQKFLLFVTGCDRIPVGGELALKIKKSAGDRASLPVAHTCFNELHLPEYGDKEEMKAKLLLAVENSEGFGIE